MADELVEETVHYELVAKDGRVLATLTYPKLKQDNPLQAVSLIYKEHLTAYFNEFEPAERDIVITQEWIDILKSRKKVKGFYFCLGGSLVPYDQVNQNTYISSMTTGVQECNVELLSDYFYAVEIPIPKNPDSYKSVMILVTEKDNPSSDKSDYTLIHYMDRDNTLKIKEYTRNLIFLDYRFLTPTCDLKINLSKAPILEHVHANLDDTVSITGVAEQQKVTGAVSGEDVGFLSSNKSKSLIEEIEKNNPIELVGKGYYGRGQSHILDKKGKLYRVNADFTLDENASEYPSIKTAEITNSEDVESYGNQTLNLQDCLWIDGFKLAFNGQVIPYLPDEKNNYKQKNLLFVRNPDTPYSRVLEYRTYENFGFTNRITYQITFPHNNIKLPNNCDVRKFIGVFKNGIVQHPGINYDIDEDGYLKFYEELDRDTKVLVWYSAINGPIRRDYVSWKSVFERKIVGWDSYLAIQNHVDWTDRHGNQYHVDNDTTRR